MSSTRDATATLEGYLRGLCPSERANLLRMSEVNAVDHQSMQHRLTAGCVDWPGLGRQMAQEAHARWGGTAAVLLVDESGFAKQGEASAGVARQWHGRLGTVDNCQVGVFATLCRGDLATLIEARLSLPEDWCHADERGQKAAIPEDKRLFQSKAQLALAMLKSAQQRGRQCGYGGMDGGYGKAPALLRGVDEPGCRWVAEVPCDQPIYRQDPQPLVPEWLGRGRPPRHRQPQSAAQRVDQWAAAQTADAGQRLTLRVGETGLLAADYRPAQVWVWDGEEEQARGGHLWVRRAVGVDSIAHDCLSHAPLDTP